MKSKLVENIIFILLFSTLSFFAACSSSDEKEDLPDVDDVLTDEDNALQDDSDNSETDNETDSETAMDDDREQDNTNNDDDEFSDDSDSTSDTDFTNDTDPEPTTDDTDTDPASEPDFEFEKESAGCTMIEVPKITMGGIYADEINGYFSPAMGENAIDIIRIMILGELKKESYELGTGLNETYMNCQQCVMVWVDVELAMAKEFYFQTHGTLTINDVVEVDEIQRTTGTIKNLIMKQVEPVDEYLSNFEFISDGKCVAAKIVEWDTTSTGGIGED